MNKRSEFNSLIAIILIVLCFALLFYLLVANLGGGMPCKTMEFKCRGQILARMSQPKVPVAGNTIGPIDVNCPFCIDYYLDGDREQIMNAIARYSVLCWDIYQRGELKNIFHGMNNQCSICVKFQIRKFEGNLAHGNIAFSGLDLKNYMARQVYQQIAVQTGDSDQNIVPPPESYLQHINNNGKGTLIINPGLLFWPKQKETYAVVFVEPHSYASNFGVTEIQRLGISAIFIDSVGNLKTNPEVNCVVENDK